MKGVASWLIAEEAKAKNVERGDCVRIRSFAGQDRGLALVTHKLDHGVKVIGLDGLEYLLCFEEIILIAKGQER